MAQCAIACASALRHMGSPPLVAVRDHGRHEGDRAEGKLATHTVQHTGNVGMRPGGFEPPTNSLEGCCSIHLSYGRAITLQQLTAPCFIALPNSATNSAKTK